MSVAAIGISANDLEVAISRADVGVVLLFDGVVLTLEHAPSNKHASNRGVMMDRNLGFLFFFFYQMFAPV